MIERDKSESRIILFIDDLRIGVNFFIGLGPNPKERKLSLVAASQNDLQEKFWESPAAKMWNVVSLYDQPISEFREILTQAAAEIYKEKGIKFAPEAIDKILELYKLGQITDGFPGYGIKLLNALVSYKIHVSSNYEVISDVMNELVHESNSRSAQKKFKNIVPEVMVIEEDDVAAYLGTEEDIIDINRDDAFSKDKLLEIEGTLKSQIIGQDEAIEYLSRALRVSSLRLHLDSKALGTFLFLGPTGVGKTETAKALAKFLYGYKDKGKKSPKNFLRIDMTEYSEKHSVSKLFGAPPGYIGYDESISLADFVRENPNAIVLFDEIDKAHPDVLNSLLHIMDESEIRSNNGEFIPMENIIIIMTSNHGAELVARKDIGFGEGANANEEVKERLMANLKKTLKPEFLNRFDEIIVFRNLSQEAVLVIAELSLKPIKENLKSRKISFVVNKKAVKALSEIANVAEYGARDLKRTIKREIMDPIAKALLSKNGHKIKKIKVVAIGRKISVTSE